jgi:hypothetical protein
MEGIIIIESSLGTRQGDPLRGLLFTLAHYWTFLKTIVWAPNCVFPSLTDDFHIVGPMSELSCAFDHLLTQLTQVGLRVKMQVLKSLKNLSKYRNFSQLHFGHIWSSHFGCFSGFLRFCHSFFRQGFILGGGTYWWSSSIGRHSSCFGHFVFMCNLSTFLFHMDSTSFLFLSISFGRFW